jgi:hypothetical protein
MCLDPMVGSGLENYRGNFPRMIIISSSNSFVLFFSRMFLVLFDIIRAIRHQTPIQKGFFDLRF